MLRGLLSAVGVYKVYERWLYRQVKDKPKPKHIGIILDGNRRWAAERSLPPYSGHRHGAEKTEAVLRWCLELGVETVTLYVFSTENFKRPKSEVRELMKLFEEKLKRLLESEDIHKYKVRVKAIGRVKLLPEKIQDLIAKVERETAKYSEHYLNLAIAYGGRAEIVDAVRKMAEDVERGKLSPGEIDEKLFSKYLYTSHLPKQEPDIIIRTSGEERLSGFLLYQSAYSKLFFVDAYWPDFRRIDLLRAIRAYQNARKAYVVSGGSI